MAVTLGALAAGKASTAGLLEAVAAGQTVGAVWASPLGGKAALVWPTQVAAGRPKQLHLDLLAAIDDWMRRHGLRLATAFLTDERGAEAEQFLLAGYKRAAEVLYLASQRSDFPADAPRTELTFGPFDESQLARLTALVEQTYEGTLDCPLLNGARQTSDVIESYRATGVYDPSRWLLLTHQGRDVGCLLLADHPQQNQWELVYMGLVPAARGKTWGMQITRHAQWLARQAGRSALVLAVDAANAPALRAYTQAGFRTWDRRFVLLKQIAPLAIAGEKIH
jgi:ribosomal protein S18 acetylase RimI-like enzyme